MTHSPAVLELSPLAQLRLDEYLRQVRRALTGVPGVSPDEIEGDIREHVEQELSTAARPISEASLEEVLNRLGPPTHWLPPGHPAPLPELPSLFSYIKARMRLIANGLWRGPEDWRLTYISFIIFAFGVMAFPIFPPFLIVSYLLARAGIAVANDKGIPIEAGKKWLLYPPIVLVSLTLLVLVVGGPPLIATYAASSHAHYLDYSEQQKTRLAAPRGPFPVVVTTPDRLFAQFPGPPTLKPLMAGTFFAGGMLVLWGAVMALLAGSFPGFVRSLFFPLLQRFEGRSTRKWGLACVLLTVFWCGLGYRVLMKAGLA